MDERQQQGTRGAGQSPTGARAREDLEAGKQKAREAAQGAKDTAAQRGREEAETRKAQAADQVEQFAHAVDRASEEFDRDSPLSSYAADLAGSMNQLAERLRGRSTDELVGDLQRLARHNPAMFFTGSLGVGFALSRFAKARPVGAEHERESGRVPGGGGYGSDYDPRASGDGGRGASGYAPPVGTAAQPAGGTTAGAYGTPGTSGTSATTGGTGSTTGAAGTSRPGGQPGTQRDAF